MTQAFSAQETAHQIDETIASIRLPLENLEFTLEDYLLQNGCRLDTETRVLLARVRDSIGRIAVSTRRLEGRGAAGAGAGNHTGTRVG